MGVSLVSVSICWPGVVDMADEVVEPMASLDSTNLSTSSLRTRPSFPVPVMSRMLMSCVLSRPRTAGVARDACFDFETSEARGSDGDTSVGCAATTSVSGGGSFGAGSAFGSGGGMSSGYFASSTSISQRACKSQVSD